MVIGRRDRALPDVGVRQRQVGILNVRRAAVAVARAAGVDQVHAPELDGCAVGDAQQLRDAAAFEDCAGAHAAAIEATATAAEAAATRGAAAGAVAFEDEAYATHGDGFS